MGRARPADAQHCPGRSSASPPPGSSACRSSDSSASAAGATAGSPSHLPRRSRRRSSSRSRAGQPPARSRPALARAVLSDRTLARWLASELLANAAWAGTLVYAGALFAESYGTSTTLTGCLLAVAAVAYVAGNLICRRLARRDPRRVLVLLAVLLAVTDGLFGAVRPGIGASTALFASAAFVAGGRTLVASAFALATAPEMRPAVTGLRAATMQFGYFAGSIAGGAALAVGGYGAFGATMGALFLAAAGNARPPFGPATHVGRARARASPPACAATGSLPHARLTSLAVEATHSLQVLLPQRVAGGRRVRRSARRRSAALIRRTESSLTVRCPRPNPATGGRW